MAFKSRLVYIIYYCYYCFGVTNVCSFILNCAPILFCKIKQSKDEISQKKPLFFIYNNITPLSSMMNTLFVPCSLLIAYIKHHQHAALVATFI